MGCCCSMSLEPHAPLGACLDASHLSAPLMTWSVFSSTRTGSRVAMVGLAACSAETPNAKHQTPNKHQLPNTRPQRAMSERSNGVNLDCGKYRGSGLRLMNTRSSGGIIVKLLRSESYQQMPFCGHANQNNASSGLHQYPR